jgi:hypothetical protein
VQLCKKRYPNCCAADSVAIAADMRPSAASFSQEEELVVVAAQCEICPGAQAQPAIALEFK